MQAYDPEIHPQKEDYNGNVNVLGFRSCYDEGKRCAETLFMDYKRKHNLNIKIVRIFNTYGPYMTKNDGRVVSNFILQALNNENITANIHVINGSVEIAPNIGLSDAICDIVSSGSTLYKNNLKEVFVIHESQAVLAGNKKVLESNKLLLEKFLFRIRAVLKAKESKYILLNAPNDKINAISEILPVLKSPTVLPLNKEGWSSLHSVINENTFWEVIDKIKDAGAEDILVCPIEKMVL